MQAGTNRATSSLVVTQRGLPILENVHLLFSIGLWGEEMLNHLKKLGKVLLQCEDNSVGSCIKCVAYLLGNKVTVTIMQRGRVFLFPSLKTATQVSHLHYAI